ncbi:MFS transporter [Histidinibacterium aquaticum]|uniref:MFS transporter n=1 Tax=Histidinibacterium aquaticum TaxID=2613962 RepID=UPI00168A50B7|nr:MFS transporter [Histidinibacterium aquaticum]
MSDSPRLLIPVLAAANVVVGLNAFLVIGVIEPLAGGFEVSEAAAGRLLTTYALSYALLSPLLVALTGRLGRRRVLAGGMMVLGLATALSALSPALVPLHLTRILAAIGAGVITPVTAAVAAGLVAEDHRARAIAAVIAGLTIAQAVGVPVGTWLGYTFGWRLAFWLVAALALPAAWLLWVTVPKGLRFTPVSLSDLGRVLATPPQMAAILFTATFLGATFLLYTYLAPLLTQEQGVSQSGVSVLLFVYGLGAVAGNLLGGAATDRVGPRRMLTGLCLLQIPLLTVFSALPLPLVAVYALVGAWSLSGWSFGAAQQVRLLKIAPERAQVLFALNAACIYLGISLGSYAGGAVLSRFGPGALGIAAAIGIALALLHLLLSDRATRRA